MTTAFPPPLGPCPCGSGSPYGGCCGPLHDGHPAPTAEALMRSRYSAYAIGHLDHVARTWHPRTRPEDLSPTPGMTWTGLQILATQDGGPDDTTGVVEFRASYRSGGKDGSLHETSRFERRGGRWVYVDGDLHD